MIRSGVQLLIRHFKNLIQKVMANISNNHGLEIDLIKDKVLAMTLY